MTDKLETAPGEEVNLDQQPGNSAEAGKDKQRRSARRQFFTGALTTLGAGLVVGASGQLSDTQKSATEIRSRIMSRIQDELASSSADEAATYDKTRGGHSKYVKAGELEQASPVQGGSSGVS
jgi:hypothetical protein